MWREAGVESAANCLHSARMRVGRGFNSWVHWALVIVHGNSAMASFVAPPGHPAQPLVLIAASYAGVKIALQAPDADLQVHYRHF